MHALVSGFIRFGVRQTEAGIENSLTYVLRRSSSVCLSRFVSALRAFFAPTWASSRVWKCAKFSRSIYRGFLALLYSNNPLRASTTCKSFSWIYYTAVRYINTILQAMYVSSQGSGMMKTAFVALYCPMHYASLMLTVNRCTLQFLLLRYYFCAKGIKLFCFNFILCVFNYCNSGEIRLVYYLLYFLT